MPNVSRNRPGVWLVGDVEHRDFAEAIALLRASADTDTGAPEVVVLAQSRPGTVRASELQRLRRCAPLAAVVALLGSWCEGETRSGRPLAGVRRFYWYEFPNWWRRQLMLRAAGRCPDWARDQDGGLRIADCGLKLGRVAVAAACWDTLAAMGDVIGNLGADCVWYRPQTFDDAERRFAAGIWAGGQLSDVEAARLASFCARLAACHAPVIALLDFPRFDRCAAAERAGAAAVLGKPWLNADLVATLERLIVPDCGATRAA
jgi:hypothetical protein